MGIDISLWRCRIGTFSQPVKCVTRLKTIKLKYMYVSLSIRVVLLLLLLAECIEPNPGPYNSRGNTGRARVVNKGRGRGRGYGRGTDIFSDSSDYNISTRRSARLQSSQSEQQNSISSWLYSSQRQESVTDGTGAGVRSETSRSEPSRRRDETNDIDNNELCDNNEYDSAASGADSDMDIVSGQIDTNQIMLETHQMVKGLNRKFDTLQKSVNELKKDNTFLKDENKRLTREVSELSASVEELKVETKKNQLKNEKLEAQSRRENLKFFNIDESDNETWDQSEQKIRGYIRTELELDETEIKIERAHRLPGRFKPRPVIVKFSFYKDKDKILSVYREKRKHLTRPENTENDQTNENENQGDTETDQTKRVRVSEDFPERVAKDRSSLIPFLQKAIQDIHRAYLKYDKLIVNGDAYTYDPGKKRPIPSDK